MNRVERAMRELVLDASEEDVRKILLWSTNNPTKAMVTAILIADARLQKRGMICSRNRVDSYVEAIIQELKEL